MSKDYKIFHSITDNNLLNDNTSNYDDDNENDSSDEDDENDDYQDPSVFCDTVMD